MAFTREEREQALRDHVVDLLDDAVGRRDLEELWSSLSLTEFGQANITRVLAATVPVEDWRVGEAFAEAWLVEHKACSFPWPFGRDLRNPMASPAGADLVGFHRHVEQGVRFAFGEVKTSTEAAAPPQVMTSRHGLHRQVEALRDDERAKAALVIYLGHRHWGQAWSQDYCAAVVRFLCDPNDIVVFGVLVRDVAPNPRDLSTRAAALASGCPPNTRLSLFALYLDAGCIQQLPDRVDELRGARQ